MLTMKRNDEAQRVFEQQSDEEKLGDAGIEVQYHQLMTGVARELDRIFNDGAERETGFVLLVFPFGNHDGRCNFISNGADRQEIVVLFKEMIARFEGQPEVHGNA
jgi:predicted component of type VI protein secretion system